MKQNEEEARLDALYRLSLIAALVDLAGNHELYHGMRVMGPFYIDGIVKEGARLVQGMLEEGESAYHVAATQFAFLTSEVLDEAVFVDQLRAMIERFKEQRSRRFVITTAVGIAPACSKLTLIRPSGMSRGRLSYTTPWDTIIRIPTGKVFSQSIYLAKGRD